MQGKVRWFDPRKGFGFIYSREFGGDIFVHTSGIMGNGGPRVIRAEDEVEFEIGVALKGEKAINVKVVSKGESDESKER